VKGATLQRTDEVNELLPELRPITPVEITAALTGGGKVEEIRGTQVLVD
jgi:hypothetical protein